MQEIREKLRLLGSERTNGYGPSSIPSPIDNEVTALLMQLAIVSERKFVESQMVERHGLVLLAYAERMASYAVRTNQEEHIVKALLALSVAGKLVYYKESLPVVSLLYRSIQKLGLDPSKLFEKIPSDGDDEFACYLKTFPSRSQEDRSIEAMGFVEGHDSDGFRYIRTW